MDLCERATQRLGERVSQQRWEQEGIDLETAKGRAAETTTMDLESNSESEEGWGGGKRIKWGNRIKWRGVEWSGVKTRGGRRARPEER